MLIPNGDESIYGALSPLLDLAKERKLPHAVIIEGASADACRRAAFALARAHLCSCDDFLSGECRHCRLILGGGHPDVTTAEGGGKSGAIPVDEVRRLGQDAALRPIEASGKVYLLDGCDAMGIPAQNAFLKAFEEPPPGVVFIITCRSSMSLLETVRSRGRVVSLGDVDETSARPPELLSLAERFCEALCSPAQGGAVMVLSYFCKDKRRSAEARQEYITFLGLVRELLHGAAVIAAGAWSEERGERPPMAEKMARTIPSNKLFAMLDELDTLEAGAKANVSMALLTAKTASIY